MIRFIDVTPYYWADDEDNEPLCAFLNTVTDTFIPDDGAHGCHIEWIADTVTRARCLRLVPTGFFSRKVSS